METYKSYIWEQCMVCFKPIDSYINNGSLYENYQKEYTIGYSCGCYFRCCDDATNAAIYRFVKENGIPEIDG